MVYERSDLGDFNSIVCFRAVIIGIEDALGPTRASTVLKRVGKARGGKLAASLGLMGTNIPPEELAKKLDAALGETGTKLCKVVAGRREGDKVFIETAETVCSAGERMGSERQCTFTLGVIWGALETVTGEDFSEEHTASVLRGGNADVFEFTKK